MTLPTSLEAFSDGLSRAIDPLKTPSVAFGVVRGKETLLLGAHGFSDPERSVLATSQTPYALASITKPLTTTVLMKLALEGLIDLDKPINDYLPGAKVEDRTGAGSVATVRNVADHSSGLHTYFRFFYQDESAKRPLFDEVIARYAKLVTPPGERHLYSNLGYGLLDHVMAAVSGQPYENLMLQRLFAPLAMKHASIGPSSGARAVAIGPDGVAYPNYTFDHPGGSAAYASVEDLLTFGRLHLGARSDFLPSHAREEMHRRSSVIDEIRGYGLGWGINEHRFGYKIVSHTGLMGGVSTVLRLVPELDLVIVILTNGQSDVAFRSADDAMAALLPTFRDQLQAERTKPQPKVQGEQMPDELDGLWIGKVETYSEEVPFALEIRDAGIARATLDGTQHDVEDLKIANKRVLGIFDGDVGTSDAAARPYRIHLDLKHEENRLYGAALTLSTNPDGFGGAPGKRYGNALPYWCELSRG